VRYPDHPSVSSSLNNLGALYEDMGDYERAKQRLKQALAIDEKISGPDNRGLVPALNNLAEGCRLSRNFTEAQPLYLRAIKILEEASPNSSVLGVMYTNLGKMYQEQGDYAQAESTLKHAMEIYEKALDPNHPSRGNLLNHLSTVYFFKGDCAQAEDLSLRALSIYKNSLSPDNPRVAEALNNLVSVYRATGKIAQAIAARKDSVAINEASLRRNLIAGSEGQKLNFLKLFANETDDTISLH